MLFFLPTALYSEYPQIKALNRHDILYKQLQDDLKLYYQAVSKGKEDEIPTLIFFTYKRQKDDDIFSVSSLLNISYDTISTLNRIANPNEFKEQDTIIISNLPGIFVPLEPESDLEGIMLSWRIQDKELGYSVTVKRNSVYEKYIFFISDRFHSIERAYFLTILFKYPLEKIWLTSSFGERKDPFTGHPVFHNGIDLGAPMGTPVYSACHGVISETGYNELYGYYIIINHAGGYQTLYGHLSEILVETNKNVQSGIIIGRVGKSGKSTGPHLHFEIRKKGYPTDPVPLLP